MEHAICFTKKEQVELVELVRPEQPEPGHVLGRTLYSLVSPGTELNANYFKEDKKPFYPGYASVLEVEQIGEGVSGMKPGDKLFCMGKHQSFQHILSSQTVPIPVHVAPAEAVVVRLMNIGFTALTTTQARPGERVIISGAGPVGLLAALLFQRAGYEVGICDPIQERRDLARLTGIKHLWNSFPLNDPDWAGRVALVLDCSGNELAVLDGCRIVRRRGEVVLAGVPWKKMSDSSAHELLSLVFHRYVILRSGWEWEIPRHEDVYSPIGIFTNLRTGMRWLSEGLLKVQPLTCMWSPSDAQGAYAGLAARRIRELFVVFDWQESNLVKGERL